MPKFSDNHRAAVAQAWRESRSHGEDQASFCARQAPSIRPRTLRQWAKLFPARGEDSGPASDLKLIHAALANLQLLADLLEKTRMVTRPQVGLAVPVHLDAEHPVAPEGRGEVGDTPSDGLMPSLRGSAFWDEP